MQLNKSTYTPPVSVNERWLYSKIMEMVNTAGFGTIEIELTIKNKQVMTIKEHARKSHSFNNGD